MKHSSLIPVERIERAIYLIRGEKVMLDRDLAELYLFDAIRQLMSPPVPDHKQIGIAQKEMDVSWRD